VPSIGERTNDRQNFTAENGVRGYLRYFVVETDSRYDDGRVVLTTPGLPAMYDSYITDAGNDLEARVIRVSPRQAPKSRRVWYVEVEYSTHFDRIDNPFTELPDIHFSSEVFDEPLPGMPNPAFTSTTDADDASALIKSTPEPDQSLIAWKFGVRNSAGHPYNPPVTRQTTRPIVTFTRNQAAFSAAYKVEWEGTVNQFPWNGLKYRQALLRTVDAQRVVWKSTAFQAGQTIYKPDVLYWRVSYVFALKAETWDAQILDYGPYYLTWSSGLANPSETPTKVQFTTDDGHPTIGLLDHSNPNKPGMKLENRADPQYNRYPAYRLKNFSELGIELNLALSQMKPPPVRASGGAKERDYFPPGGMF
jgi:hypothetical protein